MCHRPSPSAPATVDKGQISSAHNIVPDTALTLDSQIGYYVDMWKKSVDVQQHFNDIEWRIRGLALTVATFALGAAGVSAKEGTKVGPLSLGSAVMLTGLMLWYAFYFVDRFWYHPLLMAAVKHGTVIEDEIKKILPAAGMTAAITAGSPQRIGRLIPFVLNPRIGFRGANKLLHSEDKLRWFYFVGAAAFVIAAIALQLGSLESEDPLPNRISPQAPYSSSPSPSP